MITPIERQTMKKVYLRLLPFCFVLYFICYLDRVNIGFAALTMNKDLGLSATAYGLGAGIGASCVYIPTLALVGGWFTRHRTTALGLAATGTGCGTLLIPPLAAVLIQAARDSGAELVVVGRRGGDFVARTLLGSVSQRVVQNAPCDVLVVA